MYHVLDSECRELGTIQGTTVLCSVIVSETLSLPVYGRPLSSLGANLDEYCLVPLETRTSSRGSEAQSLVLQALRLRERVLGLDSERALVTMEITAGMLTSQSKYKEADRVNRRALGSFQRTLEQKHPSTLTSISNQALLLYYRGLYEEVEMLGRRALERNKTLWKLHADTLKSAGNLALILQRQGKCRISM